MQYMTLGTALEVLQGLFCVRGSVAFPVLLCLLIEADHHRKSLLPDHLGSYLLIATVSCSLFTLSHGGGGQHGLGLCQLSIILGKYLH